jgi:threonine/homoserine/homoserine lactone efflux protein
MILKIIENIVLGFAISAVPGAVFFETIRRTLAKKSTIIEFQIGNFSGMIFVAIMALLGLATSLSHPATAKFFYATSGGLLIYIGIKAAFSRPQYDTTPDSHRSPPRFSSFLSGLTLAIANPLSIIFWISLTGTFYQQSREVLPVLANTLSVLFGAFLLFAALITTAIRLRTKVKDSYLLGSTRLFGVVIAVYGILTLAKLFEA